MSEIEFKEPTKVTRTDSVIPKSINTPVEELFEMLKRLHDVLFMGGG